MRGKHRQESSRIRPTVTDIAWRMLREQWEPKWFLWKGTLRMPANWD